MSLSEAELSRCLRHARSLLDAADQLDTALAGRADEAIAAGRRWDGPHRATFDARIDHEVRDAATIGRSLRAEADAWAAAWADAVNTINQERRQAAVERLRAQRGAGERLADVFVGDDSESLVRPHEPVAVPSAANRYAATGGLEAF